jgi:hypothetical protein
VLTNYIYSRHHFKISECSCEFPKTSNTLLYEIITVRLGYHKLCVRLVLKILTGAYEVQRTVSFSFDSLLDQYHKDGD